MTLGERLRNSWVVRVLGAGAVASIIDHLVGLTLATLGVPTRVAAGSGKAAGALFSYFAHRHFSFKDHAQPVLASSVKYLVFVVLIGAGHGQVVVWLRDGLGWPYLVAAVVADLILVTPSWMLALRYVIFPKGPGKS